MNYQCYSLKLDYNIVFFLTSAMFALPMGRIADIYGMKKVFKYGIIILTLVCFLSAIAPNADFLIISRVIQGI
jgi:MFS family permease